MSKKFIAKILDAVWPRECEICHGEVDRDSRHVCSACLMRLPFASLTGCCKVCGRAVSNTRYDFLCDDCRGPRAPKFDRAFSAFNFDGCARDIVIDYKLARHFWMREDIVDWLEGALRARFAVTDVDLVVPMPITLAHRFLRGYNQTSDIALSLSKRLDRKFSSTCIKRIGSPRRQSSLSEEERRKNAVGTFKVTDPRQVKGRTVLVIDDTMATGSTMSECARELKNSGAHRVWGLTVARSLYNQ
jgi:ComF family protein